MTPAEMDCSLQNHAALLKTEGAAFKLILDALRTAMPAYNPRVMVVCPALGEVVYDQVCVDRDNSAISLIMHLNDGHKWTREQVADWLDTLEVDLSFGLVD